MKKQAFAFPMFCGRGLLSSLALLALGAGGGCAGVESPGDELGQVSVSLSVVPADIQCLRVTGDGGDRSVVRDLDVGGAAPLTATLTGIPLGPVTFAAQAYAGACADVTKSTIADWVSDPTTVSVALGH